MGGMIAQELALFSNKIDKLIIASSHCGQDITQPSKDIQKLNDVRPSELKEKLLKVLYPEGFDFSTLPKSSEIVSDKTIAAQQKAILDWRGTCDKLEKIKQETLVIVGKHDNLTPPPNSALIAKNIKGSSLIKIEGGHVIAAVYPDKFADIILLFLNK
jgi:pimeloyl-ACP methyl ester carboxylesterase